MDDVAFGGSERLADLERIRIGQGDQKVAAIALEVLHQVLEAFDQRAAVGLDRLLDGDGVGGEEVRGREEIDELMGEEVDLLGMFFIVPHIGSFGEAFEIGGHDLVLAFQVVEERMLRPFLV